MTIHQPILPPERGIPTIPTIIIEKSGHDLFVVDTRTGDILDQVLGEPERVHSRVIDRYVGIDTRFPRDARDAAELIEAVSVHDPFMSRLKVDYERLLGLISIDHPTTDVLVLRFLCEHLTAWNCWYGSIDDLAQAVPGVGRRALLASLSNLEQGLIKRPKKGARGAQFIHVHPWYAFRGADYIREELLRRWCLPRLIPHK